MKKLYITLATVCVLMLVSCNGRKEYEAYIQTLTEQPAVIDTISTPASYAAYLSQLQELADRPQQEDLKLNDTQKDEIQALCLKIEEALQRTYNRMAQTPMLIDATAQQEAEADSLSTEAQEAQIPTMAL